MSPPVRECDLAVIGGGLAGLGAARCAARLGLQVVAFCGPAPGGLLLSIESIQGLSEHPEGIAGYDLGPMLQEEAMAHGATCLAELATGLQPQGGGWLVEGEGSRAIARAVVLAMGSRLRTLGVPGEQAFAGKGVSHCASCDAPMLRGREVAVVGGGDAACQEALTLAAHASRVHLLVRGPEPRARSAWRERIAREPKIQVRPGVTVDAIVGTDRVNALRLRSGAGAGAGENLAVDAVFIYAGLEAASELAGPHVERDGAGRIVVDGRLQARSGGGVPGLPGLFAAGSVRAGSNTQAEEAIADGIAAAAAAQAFIHEHAMAARAEREPAR